MNAIQTSQAIGVTLIALALLPVLYRALAFRVVASAIVLAVVVAGAALFLVSVF